MAKKKNKRSSAPAPPASEPLPPEATGLGRHIAGCGPRRGLSPDGRFVLYLLLSGLIILVMCGWATFVDKKKIPDLERLFWIALFVVPIGFALLFWWEAWRKTGLFVHLLTGGILVREGETWQRFPWEDIDEVWQSSSAFSLNFSSFGTKHSFWLRRRDGHQVKLTHYLDGINGLGEHILAETRQRKLPVALEQIVAGEEVRFGDLRVSRKSISVGGNTLLWNEAGSVKVEQGSMALWRKGSLFPIIRLQTSGIPNVHVLIDVVNALLPATAA
jgi:Family of unknown function (DUF6585)